MKILTIYGHIGFDAVKESANGAEYIRISVAVNEKHGDTQRTDWVTVFTRQANLLPYLKKGTAIVVTGHAKWKPYNHQASGTWQVSVSINAHHIQLAGSPKEQAPEVELPKSENVDDLPF